MATRIKRYEERKDKLDQLLGRIEDEMGPQAQLEAREFSRGRILGLFGGQNMIEIIATAEVELNQKPPVQQVNPVVSTTPSAPAKDYPKQAPPRVVPEPIPHPTELIGVSDKQSLLAKAVDSGQRQVDLQANEPLEVPFATEAPVQVQPILKPVVPAEAKPVVQLQPEQLSPIPAVFESNPQKTAVNEPAEPSNIPSPSLGVQADSPEPQLEPGVVENPKVSASNDDLAEIRDTISELKQTIGLLVAQGQTSQPAITPSERNNPPGMSIAQDLSMVNPLAIDPGTTFSGVQRNVFDILLDWNIGPYDAIDLINTGLSTHEAPDQLTEESLIQMVTRDICRNVLLSVGIQLNPTPPGKVVALVGSTGVGKSTTIAKLAAHFAFQGGKRVSLVSLDNYRIAAAEQLRTYTDIMGIDLDIVFSKDEFDQVLTQRSHNDLILIDTAGRSPLNTKQIYELRDIFSAHPPDEVHLVVSASTKGDDVRTILENFEPLSYDHVIVSKLDETRSLGCIYNINKLCKMPISYFTIGQSVPEDIRTATLSFIQGWISQGRII